MQKTCPGCKLRIEDRHTTCPSCGEAQPENPIPENPDPTPIIQPKRSVSKATIIAIGLFLVVVIGFYLHVKHNVDQLKADARFAYIPAGIDPEYGRLHDNSYLKSIRRELLNGNPHWGVAKLQTLATTGDRKDRTLAYYHLGVCYHYGIGCEKDLSTAFSYHNRAAELGSARAKMHLYLMVAFWYSWNTNRCTIAKEHYVEECAESVSDDPDDRYALAHARMLMIEVWGGGTRSEKSIARRLRDTQGDEEADRYLSETRLKWLATAATFGAEDAQTILLLTKRVLPENGFRSRFFCSKDDEASTYERCLEDSVKNDMASVVRVVGDLRRLEKAKDPEIRNNASALLSRIGSTIASQSVNEYYGLPRQRY